MASFFFFIFFSISVNLLLATAGLSPDDDFNFCSDEHGNYTANTAFKTNLDLIFSNYSSLSTSHFTGGFYNFSAGVNPDKVNSLALCRGDLQASDCYACLHNLRTDLIKKCPDQKEVIGWYYGCMFRYSTRSLFGVVDNTTKIMTSTGDNATSPANVNEFETSLGNLVNKVSSMAASGGSVRKFATGNVSVPEAGTLYALAQCTPDVSQLDCENCLFGAYDDVRFSFGGKVDGVVFLPSCHLRYGNETLAYRPSPSPPPSPFSPESPTMVTSGTSAKGWASQMLVVGRSSQILVVAALAQLLVLLF